MKHRGAVSLPLISRPGRRARTLQSVSRVWLRPDLRAEEVIHLQLEDIDCRAGEILVRGKGKRYDRLPLPTDVGQAMTEYIRKDRKSSSTRAVFVTSVLHI